MSELTITPSQLAEALDHCEKTNIVPFITSSPGVGKSSIVEQHARKRADSLAMDFYRFTGNSNHSIDEMEAGYGFIDFRANMITQADLYGLPTFTEDKSAYKFARPDMLPTHGQGIIFCDELPQATPAVMGGFSELFLNHRVGNHVIPKGWKIVVAGNRKKDRAATNNVPTHIKDRLNELALAFNLDDYVKWATDNDVHGSVIAFVRFRPAIVDSFDPKLETNCTPRSLTMVSELVGAPESVRYPLIAGCIGEGPAAEFSGFLRMYQELPSVEFILQNPKTAPLSAELDVLYAVTTALALQADESNFGKMMRYIKRIEQTEFQVSFVRQAVLRDNEIISLKEFSDFVSTHKEVLL